MQRRTLLRALTSVPFLGLMFPRHGGTLQVLPAARIPAGPGEFLVFLDEEAFDPRIAESLAEMPPMPGFEAAITFLPVRVPSGKTLDDVVKIYRLEGNDGDSDSKAPEEEAPWLRSEPERT